MPNEDIVGYISETRGQCCYVRWKIDDFFSRPSEEGDEWESPEFHFAGTTWFLSVYPNEMDDYSDGHITLDLNRNPPYSSLDNAICIFGVRNNSGSLNKSCVITDGFRGDNLYCEASNLVTRQKLKNDMNLASGGTVTFSVLISDSSDFRENADSHTSTYNDLTVLSKDLRNLFLSEQNSDVTIKVADKEFRAHSQILAARSSVFAPMFTHDMKEKNSGIVDVPDCHPEAFRQFLMFAYSGKVEKMSTDIVLDLYCTAVKYDVNELKIQCSAFMKENMSVDTFCDVISLSIRYNDMELITYAKEFFVKNIKKIIVTVKWMSFAKEYPVQANELIIKTVNERLPD